MRFAAFLGAVLFLAACLVRPASADLPDGSPIALLGLADATREGGGAEALLPILREEASKRWTVLAEDQVRPILREHRIRSFSSLDPEDGSRIAAATGARALLLGSVTIYREGEDPEVALSLRLLDPADLRILAAASAAMTGFDRGSLFEIGRVHDPAMLAREAVREALDKLAASVEEASGSARRSRIAIVPFDGTVREASDGQLLTELLLPVLHEHRYDVIEPGLLRRHFERRRVGPRGGIDLETLAAIRAELSVDLVITGEVDEALEAEGDPAVAVPLLRYGIRLIDASSGRLLAAIEEEKEGDGSRLLPIGRTTSLGRLVEGSLDRLVSSIDERPWEDHASKR